MYYRLEYTVLVVGILADCIYATHLNSKSQCPKSIREELVRLINKSIRYQARYPVLYSYVNYEENVPPCFRHPKVFHKTVKPYSGYNHCGHTQNPKLNDLAVCQWTYVLNQDSNRIPEIIVEAKCCNTKNFGCKKRRRCRPYVITFPVARRKNDASQWELTLEQVSVGCICTKKRKIYEHRPQQNSRQCSVYRKAKMTKTIIAFNKFADQDNPYFHTDVRLNHKGYGCLKNPSLFSHNILETNMYLPSSFRRYTQNSIFCNGYYIQTYDKNRIPDTMTNVKCKRSKRGNKCTKCAQLKINVPVLRRDTESADFEPTIERIGVGCVCKSRKKHWQINH